MQRKTPNPRKNPDSKIKEHEYTHGIPNIFPLFWERESESKMERKTNNIVKIWKCSIFGPKRITNIRNNSSARAGAYRVWVCWLHWWLPPIMALWGAGANGREEEEGHGRSSWTRWSLRLEEDEDVIMVDVKRILIDANSKRGRMKRSHSMTSFCNLSRTHTPPMEAISG